MNLRGYRKVEEEKKGENITDIIVQKRKNGKKFLIRVVAQSNLSSGSIGVRWVRSMKKELEKRDMDGILVGGGIFTPSAKVEARRKNIELISGNELPSFNIFKHKLVPKHEIISKKEAEELLKKYRVKPWKLPLINVSDPAAKMIGAKPGDILKITRESPTAGKAIAYRYVISEVA